MEIRTRENKRYCGTSRNLKRTLWSQLVPLILMLFVGSWLTLAAGKMIDQTRVKSVGPPTLEQSQLNRF